MQPTYSKNKRSGNIRTFVMWKLINTIKNLRLFDKHLSTIFFFDIKDH